MRWDDYRSRTFCWCESKKAGHIVFATFRIDHKHEENVELNYVANSFFLSSKEIIGLVSYSHSSHTSSHTSFSFSFSSSFFLSPFTILILSTLLCQLSNLASRSLLYTTHIGRVCCAVEDMNDTGWRGFCWWWLDSWVVRVWWVWWLRGGEVAWEGGVEGE